MTTSSGVQQTPRRLGVAPSFAASALAACSACLITNPAEVAKTRLQLDGEGGAAASAIRGGRQYKGVAHALATIARSEGLRGLQAGLLPALCYQTTMNGARLGLYEPVQHLLRERAGVDTSQPWAKGLSGAMSGAVGAALGSPFYLVKSRLQAQGVGFKAREAHRYSGMKDAFASITRAEGARGLLRGVDGALPRVMCGSAAQLSSYDVFKAALARQEKESPTGAVARMLPPGVAQHLAASLAASLITVTVMNPLDVVSTRLYQSAGVNTKYRGPVDCLLQTVRAEGHFALQKGWTAQFARLGPHTVLTFVFLEQIRPWFLSIDAFLAD